MKTIRLLTKAVTVAVALGASLGISCAMAQAYPNKPIKFVVPFSAGSATDIVARTVAEAMGKT
ncbi:MAG: hypothetical protein EBR27_05945, partial [Betaproteobacteria bacterium]|nr:hypothetical protein [Betaproteobacteria bacterium]